MTTFAILENNVVINVIVADSKTIAEEATGLIAIEYTEENPAKIGQTYNQTNNTFYTIEEAAAETPAE
jgi:hypothetical protein